MVYIKKYMKQSNQFNVIATNNEFEVSFTRQQRL